MPVVAVLHHLAQPSCGHAGPVLRAAGLELDDRDLAGGGVLPRLDEVDALLSLGGAQSVLDGGLEAEARLLAAAVERGVPVLGVCLGAQLLAHALGGRVRRAPRRLVGWPVIEALPDAPGDPLVGALPPAAAALHWNEDGFEPPPGAVELLRRPGGSCEAFRFGAAAWGVQFHPEVDAAMLDGWYRDWPQAPGEAGVGVEEARAADARHLPGQAALAEAIFGGFARVVAYAPSAGRGRDQMSAHAAQTSSGTSPARMSTPKTLQPRQ